MSTPIQEGCSPEDDVERARDLMQQHKVQRILVCDAQEKPVGVISLQDLARSESEGEIGQTVREVKEEGARVH
jgi:CBS domain-containing protein